MLIRIDANIDMNEAFAYLQSPEAGGHVLFIGTVRNQAQGKVVVKLSFEAYHSMALKEMNRIAALAASKWEIKRLVIIHATGSKNVGEPVVITGVSAVHRDTAFQACQFLIDELKKTVPIWKNEFFEDNSVWVNAHP